MDQLLLALDLLSIAAGLLAAFFWHRAARQRLRRVSRTEVLDAADINRIVTSINRNNILNRRAALATAFSALCLAGRSAVSLLSGI